MAKKTKKDEPAKLTIVDKVSAPSVQDILESFDRANESTLARLWRENGITHHKLALQPKMEQPFKLMGGLEIAAEYLRGSEDPDALKFLEVFDRVDINDRDFLGFDGFCVAADVSGRKIFGMIVSESMANSEQTVAFITAVKNPEVVEYTAQVAMTPAGHRERKLMAQASGWLPRPKGAQTNIQINTANGMPGKSMPSMTLPPIDQELRELGERFQTIHAKEAPRMLEAGDIIDAEED